MKRRIASQHGWFRISARDGQVAAAGQPRFFKGYAVTGADGAEDGVFVEWDWDGQRLAARTCTTGFLPLYYFFDGEQIALATRLEDIFAATGTAPRLCGASLGVLLRLGFMVGDRTPFAGVMVLGPQGSIAWRPGALPEIRSAYPRFAQVDCADAAARYAELFRDAMARIAGVMSSDFVVPLSGGRDSRHIALELHLQARKPRFAVTARHLPPRNNEDARVAATLCQAMGWRHLVVGQPVLGRYAQEEAHARAVDYMTFEHAWTLPVRDAIEGQRVSEVFDGVGGDVLSAGLFQDEQMLELYAAGRIDAVRERLLGYWSQLGGEAALKESLAPALAGAADAEPALALIDAELRLHKEQPNPLKSFYFWNRSRRGTGLLPFKIFGGMVAYAPYLDRALLAFLMGLGPAATRDRQLHTEAIRLADPVIGAIPYEDKDAGATPQRISDRVGFYGPLMARACIAGSYLNRRFVLPRAAQSLLAGADLQSTWWKPRRVAYLAGLHRFVAGYRPETRTQRMAHYAFNDR